MYCSNNTERRLKGLLHIQKTKYQKDKQSLKRERIRKMININKQFRILKYKHKV